MSLYLGPSGKLLVRDGKLAASEDCCCGGCAKCGGECLPDENCVQLSWEMPFTGDCARCAGPSAETEWDKILVPASGGLECTWNANLCGFVTIDEAYDLTEAQIRYSNGCYELTLSCRQATEQGTTTGILWRGCKGGSAPYGECDGDGVYHKVDGCPDGPGSICATKLDIENCGCRKCNNCDEEKECGFCGVSPQDTPMVLEAVLEGFSSCLCVQTEDGNSDFVSTEDAESINGTHILDQVLDGDFPRCTWAGEVGGKIKRKKWFSDSYCSEEADSEDETANVQLIVTRVDSETFRVFLTGEPDVYLGGTCCEELKPNLGGNGCELGGWFNVGTVTITPCSS